MAPSLDDVLPADGDTVAWLRENATAFSLGTHFPAVPNEVTNWLAEQRAIVESCALGDLSHHMETVHARGPDALRLFEDLCANSFSGVDVGQAKHAVLASPDGFLIGDGPVLRLGEEECWGVPWGAENWLRYQHEVGDYDVDLAFDPPTAVTDGDPETFIYQVQGPNAFDVLDAVCDVDLRDVGFYRFREVTVAGHAVRAFGHGMSTQPGVELHGPYEHAGAVAAAILEAGEPHGIRKLGSKAYNSQSVRLGWIGAGPPPIYEGESMAPFRRWLDAESREATFSIEGSYRSDDVSDYYMDPVEYGFGRLVSLDHDFVGRDALEARLADPDRTFVSLLWDDEAVVDVYASLFGDGPHHKYFELPRARWASAAFDAVRLDGDPVGISRRRSYQPDVRGVVSLAVVDAALSEPGTEVTVVWGEGPDSPNPRVEDHAPTEIPATVAPVPYTEDLRKADPPA